MPFIDDDQVEEVGRDSPGQARSAVAVNLLNIGVNDMALLQAALKRQRAEFAGDGQVISTEDHIKVNPEIVFQEVLGLPNALLGHKTRGDDQDTPRSEERRVGKECVSTCRSRWSQYHEKKNTVRRLDRDSKIEQEKEEHYTTRTPNRSPYQ